MYENLLRNGVSCTRRTLLENPKKPPSTTLRRSTLHHKLESASRPVSARPPLQTFGRRQAGGHQINIFSARRVCRLDRTARRTAPAIGRAVVFSVYLAIQLASLRARGVPAKQASHGLCSSAANERPPDRATRCPARRHRRGPEDSKASAPHPHDHHVALDQPEPNEDGPCQTAVLRRGQNLEGLLLGAQGELPLFGVPGVDGISGRPDQMIFISEDTSIRVAADTQATRARGRWWRATKTATTSTARWTPWV